jgi:hypothetical protein
MADIQRSSGTTPPLSHIFTLQSTQTRNHPPKAYQPIAVDQDYYTKLTDQLLDQFYPKFCCGERITTIDKTRPTMLRCPVCHKHKSRLVETPLQNLKIGRWIFSYLLKESEIQYPKVLTSQEISKRVGVTITTALLLKRRLQLFASEVIPRMQRKFYQDNKLGFSNFKLPKDRTTDLTQIVKNKPIPQADTVVLYSCSTTANKGRKRYKRTGQTASIYMSESLGGKQRGTLVNTLGIKNGPVFYDSIPNQKAETINPILGKYIPVHNPLFTDMGYRGYPGMNHRMVNHSRKSPDKRYQWSRNRWSKNGIHCNVAEGNQSVLKRAFGSYVWIDPKHSQLYLDEYSFLGNLRYFDLDDLLPDTTKSVTKIDYKLDRNWDMCNRYKKIRRGGDSNPR